MTEFNIHIIDEDGNVCITAETVMGLAKMRRENPMTFARREAKAMSGPDGTFQAVRQTNDPN